MKQKKTTEALWNEAAYYDKLSRVSKKEAKSKRLFNKEFRRLQGLSLQAQETLYYWESNLRALVGSDAVGAAEMRVWLRERVELAQHELDEIHIQLYFHQTINPKKYVQLSYLDYKNQLDAYKLFYSWNEK